MPLQLAAPAAGGYVHPHNHEPALVETQDEVDASDPNWLIALALVFEVGAALLIVFYVGLLG